MNRGVFFALLAFGAVALVAGLMFLLLSPFLSAVAWAVVLALAAQPLHRRIQGACGGRGNLAAGLTTTAVLLIVAVPILVLGVLFAQESVKVFSFLQDAIAQGKIPGRDEVMANPRVAQWVHRLEPYFTLPELKDHALEVLRQITSQAMTSSRRFAGNLFRGVLGVFVMVAVLFFSFRDGPLIVREVWTVLLLKQRDRDLISAALQRVVYAVLYGIVLTCVIQGALAGLGFAFVGLPSPVFFGAIMILAAFIPVVGVALVWAPGVLYLLATGAYGKGIFLLIWCVSVVSVVDNVVRPFFIGGKAQVPFLAVLLGVLCGFFSLGLLGVILGPLMFVVAIEVIRIYGENISSDTTRPSSHDG